MQCPKCNFEIQSNVSFCPNCGQVLTVKEQLQRVIEQSTVPEVPKNNLKGIGGWLILIAIYLISGLLFLIIQFIFDITDFSKPSIAESVKGYLALSIINGVIFITLQILTLLFFLREQKLFITFYLITILLSIFSSFFFYVIQQSDPEILNFLEGGVELELLFGAFLIDISLIIYILKSKRVKATFVN
ncbi:MAG: DUF2569 family protein [bacterium]|nr:DUF2569 family protein [bacterium]